MLVGCTIGIPASLAASRDVRSHLFGLTPTDGLTLGAAVLATFAVGAVAAYLPARSAARIDPLSAIRAE